MNINHYAFEVSLSDNRSVETGYILDDSEKEILRAAMDKYAKKLLGENLDELRASQGM